MAITTFTVFDISTKVVRCGLSSVGPRLFYMSSSRVFLNASQRLQERHQVGLLLLGQAQVEALVVKINYVT